MNTDRIKETFFLECAEQMAEIEESLMSLHEDPAQPECINAVFRAVHSVKGGAGAFGFNDLVHFAHVVENGLDVLRNGANPGADPRLDLIARATDILSDAISATRDGTAFPETAAIVGEITTAFALGDPDAEEEDIAFDAVPIAIEALEIAAPQEQVYLITLRPQMSFYVRGDDMLKLIRSLAELGRIQVDCDQSALPDLDGFDPDKAYLTWSIRLETAAPREEVDSVFEWLDEDCQFSIDVEGAGSGDDFDLDALLAGLDSTGDVPAPDAPFGLDVPALEPLEATGAVEERDILTPPALAGSDADLMPLDSPAPAPAVAEIEARDRKEPRGATPAQAAAAQGTTAKATATIRVESEKVDRLINLMGEAVISQAMLAERIAENIETANGSTSYQVLDEMQGLMREIQESVMSIRAQPVKPVFMRLARVIREACTATGKQARLVLEGEGTEVDTTVIENLNDPLTHLIRNAIDHGLESPEKRRELGKPEEGTIKVSAFHMSGRIVVTIDDDGAGINRKRVLEKAVEKGIVDAGAELADSEIDNLVFAPGFSTAQTVSDLSGRGVGMDVVRQSIQKLGGRVSIISAPGKGTQIRLSLPLTLAILDGMIVRAADEVFIVPITSVIETISVKKGDINIIGGKYVARRRDTLVPVINVAERLGFRGAQKDMDSGTLLVVEAQDGSVVALLIDEIEGQQQIVIKSLEQNFGSVRHVSAATILGTGRIALILDIDEIASTKHAEARSHLQNGHVERMSA